jgi:hypothetical protein
VEAFGDPVVLGKAPHAGDLLLAAGCHLKIVNSGCGKGGSPAGSPARHRVLITILGRHPGTDIEYLESDPGYTSSRHSFDSVLEQQPVC